VSRVAGGVVVVVVVRVVVVVVVVFVPEGDVLTRGVVVSVRTDSVSADAGFRVSGGADAAVVSAGSLPLAHAARTASVSSAMRVLTSPGWDAYVP
jgi:hypothetical protein